MINLSHRSF